MRLCEYPKHKVEIGWFLKYVCFLFTDNNFTQNVDDVNKYD